MPSNVGIIVVEWHDGVGDAIAGLANLSSAEKHGGGLAGDDVVGIEGAGAGRRVALLAWRLEDAVEESASLVLEHGDEALRNALVR